LDVFISDFVLSPPPSVPEFSLDELFSLELLDELLSPEVVDDVFELPSSLFVIFTSAAS
jgi:hypothetical protein